MTYSETRHIPSGIKKEVRRRCGYGCVVCGCPVYEIDHMVDWSSIKEHKAENLTLLCGTHHDQKTKGMLSREYIMECNSKPFAVDNPESLTAKWQLSSEVPSFIIATNNFKYQLTDSHFAPILVKYFAPLKFYLEDGHVLFDFIAHDRTGKEIIKIEHNEMLLLPNNYDVEITGSSVIIREGPRKILLDLNIETAENTITLRHASLKVDKYDFKIEPSLFQVNGAHLHRIGYSGCTFHSMIAVSVESPKAGMPAVLYIA